MNVDAKVKAYISSEAATCRERLAKATSDRKNAEREVVRLRSIEDALTTEVAEWNAKEGGTP